MEQNKKEEQDFKSKKIKRVKIKTVIYAVLIFFLFIVFVMSILAYGTNTKLGKTISGTISRVFPFPAVIINYTDIIQLGDVEKNLASVKRFYENQDFSSSGLRVDFSTDAGKKRLKLKEKEVLNKMLEDRIIILLAKKRNINVNAKDVDSSVSKKLNEYGGKTEDTEKSLKQLYGWSMDDFKKNIVMQSLYKEALEKDIASELKENTAPKEKITKAESELKAGKSFAEVAKQYSEGSSAKDGGNLGWVSKSQLLPTLSLALFPDKGNPKTNQILESTLGFHIIDILNKKNQASQETDPMIEIRQIFVRKPTFANWLSEQMKGMTIWIPLNEYRWNKDSATIEFKDQDMLKFEKENYESSNGDVSVKN